MKKKKMTIADVKLQRRSAKVEANRQKEEEKRQKKEEQELDWDSPYIPSRGDISKFHDESQESKTITELAHNRIIDMMKRFGIDLDQLTHEDGSINYQQSDILNDFIDEYVYQSDELTIIDVLSPVVMYTHWDYRRLAKLLSARNYDGVRLELANKFHIKGSINPSGHHLRVKAVPHVTRN